MNHMSCHYSNIIQKDLGRSGLTSLHKFSQLNYQNSCRCHIDCRPPPGHHQRNRPYNIMAWRSSWTNTRNSSVRLGRPTTPHKETINASFGTTFGTQVICELNIHTLGLSTTQAQISALVPGIMNVMKWGSKRVSWAELKQTLFKFFHE